MYIGIHGNVASIISLKMEPKDPNVYDHICIFPFSPPFIPSWCRSIAIVETYVNREQLNKGGKNSYLGPVIDLPCATHKPFVPLCKEAKKISTRQHVTDGKARIYSKQMVKRGFKLPKIKTQWTTEERKMLAAGLQDNYRDSGEYLNEYYWMSSKIMDGRRTAAECEAATKRLAQGLLP